MRHFLDEVAALTVTFLLSLVGVMLAAAAITLIIIAAAVAASAVVHIVGEPVFALMRGWK